MAEGAKGEERWAKQGEALRRWADRGRAAWMLSEGVRAALEALGSEGDAGALIRRLEAVVEQGLGASWIVEREPVAAEGVARTAGRTRAGGGERRSRPRVARPWKDGGRALGELQLVAVFVGSVKVREAWASAAVGVAIGGSKHVLGLWRGCTADRVVAREVLESLAARGLDADRGPLVVHGGSQAVDAVARRVWMLLTVCVETKRGGDGPAGAVQELREDAHAVAGVSGTVPAASECGAGAGQRGA